jgi:DNA-binding response OmpR family regulator
MNMQTMVVVVEDEKPVRDHLTQLLQDNGFLVTSTGMGTEVEGIMEKIRPQLVLLDLQLPDIQGQSICRQIKKNDPDTVVIMLTSKDTPQDISEGFDIGADDYIKKPFSDEELVARIKARLKQQTDENEMLKVGDISLNMKTYKLTRDGEEIPLTPQEFKLLEYLIRNANRVLTREMILNRIWLYSPDIESRVVDVYIGYLRKKIDAGHDKKYIHSVRGFGYMFKES